MNKKIGLLLAGLVLLPACVQVPVYRGRPLGSMDNTHDYRESKNGMIVRIKRLTSYDKSDLFGEYAKKLSCSNKPVEVIYCSFHNLSATSYVLPLAGIDLAMIPSKKIVRLMQTNVAGRLASFGATCLVGASLMVVSLWGFLWTACEGNDLGRILLFSGIGGTTISAIHGSKQASSVDDAIKANEHIAKDLKVKILSEEATILQPGDKHEGLIFVKSADYASQFKVILHEHVNRNNKIAFDVDLQASFKTYDQDSQ